MADQSIKFDFRLKANGFQIARKFIESERMVYVLENHAYWIAKFGCELLKGN